MSGVRAHNEELTNLGLTLPGFVERNKVVASLPSLSLLTLAALTPERHSLEYLEIFDIRNEKIDLERFDLVAITSFSAQIKDAYQVADECRRKGIAVVLGGLHVSALPNEAKQHADSVVVGEGEPVWPKLVEDFENGRLQPMYTASPGGSYDLANAPIPAYHLLTPEKYNRLTVQTSRGCPWRCSFCASSILLTPKYKLKPIPKVIDEIKAIKDVWGQPFIELADDNSFSNKRHSRDLVRALAKEELKWFTETDISVAEDDELLGLLRESGCRQVLIGLESPRAQGLDGIEMKTNWKLRQRDGYRKAIEKIQSYGITVNGCFVLGLDGDTPDVFEEVHDFVLSSGLYEVQITLMTPFPGTPLYDRLLREGRIIRPGAWELCTMFDNNVVPKNMTVDELQQGMLWLGKQLYSREETAARRAGFFRALRESPNRTGAPERGLTSRRSIAGVLAVQRSEQPGEVR
jgi:radical SAM superfamily enzyme YgiQ (UPF0313 family)